MPQRTYDLHGVVLRIDAAHESLAAFMDIVLAPLAAAGTPAPHWTIVIDTVDAVAPVPPGARIVWDGPLPEGLPATLYDDGEGRIFVAPGHFRIAQQRGRRATDIAVAPAGWKSISGSAVFWMLDRVLLEFDHHLLHGACLLRPDRSGAIALFAPSGTGKTTTALALARAGLALAGDDALVLRNTDAGPLLWGIPRKLRVHRKTAAMMPWLAPSLVPFTQDEQSVTREAVAGAIDIAAPVRCPAIGAIMLRMPNADGNRIDAISKVDAVSHITTDNVRRAPGGVEAGAVASFAAIARFVARTPVIALSVGPDPGSLDLGQIFAALR